MRALPLVALIACHADPRPAVEPPRLVVLVVIDQWPAWAFAQKHAAFEHGFRRLLGEGQWRTGEHPSAATLTAPGHALLGTGHPTATSGIVANEWYHRELGKRLQSVEDGDARSARWLRVPGLADNFDGRAVAVSLKDRSAILTLGHRGTPIWYGGGKWKSTGELPAWLPAIDPDRVHAPWQPLDAARLAQLAPDGDAQPGEVGEKKFGPTFPHEPDATGDPADAVFSQPLGNTLVLEAATAAIPHADLLVISLSAHDYIGHGWGQESWEMWDAELRLDRELGAFLAALDREVGAGRWSMIVTSDHGASPMPERGKGGRIVFEELHAALERAADDSLGEGTWVADAKYPFAYFSRELLALPAERRDRGIAAITAALSAFPGVDRVFRTADFAGNCEARTGDARGLCYAIDPERSGELMWLPREHWITQEVDERVATAHGSLHAYDRRVPAIVLAPGRVAHAPSTAPEPGLLPITEVAPQIARWLSRTAR